MGPRKPLLLLLIVFFLGAAGVLVAQWRTDTPQSRVRLGVVPEERSGFTFCRLYYTSTRREQGGYGWSTDFPLGDENLMFRLAELTKTGITRFSDGAPEHALVRATDDALFECPFLFASDIGTVTFNSEEVEGLREYFLKGGQLWVDDFWGVRAFEQFSQQILRVLPEYSIAPLPPEHPIFSSFYYVDEIPQLPNIQHWRGTGGQTSERGRGSQEAKLYAILDEHGRTLVLMTHNTDIADSWEREGEDFQFFHLFSPKGYSVGVNVAIWSMTH